MHEKLRLGLLGAGTIGTELVRRIAAGELPYSLSAVMDDSAESVDRAQQIVAGAGQPEARSVSDMAELCSNCDVAVEAASSRTVATMIAAADGAFASAGRPRHVLIMSVGGLLDVEGLDSRQDGPVIHAPSGAVGGLDAVQGLRVAGLDEVRLTTRKPPAGLGLEVSEETLLFEGSAREVFAKYPKNVNVAVALSLAGIGPDRTRCRLVADPAVTRNTHEVYARGPAGEVEFTARNEPFPSNPATSYLAALSAVSLLKRLAAHLQVG
jgi:aspartate dehydrogenase